MVTITVIPDPPTPGDDVCVVVSGPGPGRPNVTVFVNGAAQPLTSTAEIPGTVLTECFTVPANTYSLEIQAYQAPCPLQSLAWSF